MNSALWLDKYRPNSLAKLSLNKELTMRLQSLSLSEEMPHLLFYGPTGAGKKTRVMALLREIFGGGVEKMKLEHRNFKTPSGKALEITTLSSNYHLECNPSDVGTNDRFVIQEVIKEIASHTSLQSSIGAPGAKNFKVLILSDADRLSRQAQAALRRTMEKYSSQCRIILICNSPSKIIDPLRSRCLGIRVPAPSHEDISAILMQVSKKEGCNCPPELALKLSKISDRNLRRALLMVESCARVTMNSNPSLVGGIQIMPDIALPYPDWEIFIHKLARDILEEQTPARLLQARDALYELLTNCIPGDVILITLCKQLFLSLDDELKHEVSHWAAYYEHRMAQGSKEIFHLEAFIAKFMAIYKKWLISMLDI